MSNDRSPRLVGINHVALEVGDIDKALSFYGAIFRFDLRGRSEGMAFLDMGDQFLALSEGRSQGPDGDRHFGLVVDDRSDIRALAEAACATLVEGPFLDFLYPWATGSRLSSTATSNSSRRIACCTPWACRLTRATRRARSSGRRT